ncbi:response regulator [Candidatus Pacearchaeota archaeon]|nr:response regulator [Candidatus Pacearchaeota archaeon]
MKILIVDDNKHSRSLLNKKLKDFGHKTKEALTGEEGLGMILTGKFDLVLLDWQLPGMSGLDVLYKLRSEGNNTLVIFVTAHSNLKVSIEAFKLGIVDYVLKPFGEYELKKALSRAESMHDSKEFNNLMLMGKMASGIAHDFSNILTAFDYFLLIKSELKKIKENQDNYLILKRIEENCDAGRKGIKLGISLVNGLTAFASGAVEGKENVDIDQLIKNISSIFKRDIKNKGITFKFFPSTDEKILKFNRGKIQQVVLNLLTNAIDAVSGSETKEIIIKTKKTNGNIIVEVCDSGNGIKDTSVIFNDFFTTKKTGHGIGLSTTKRIIDEYGGKIEVNSLYSRGSEFTVYFPC